MSHSPFACSLFTSACVAGAIFSASAIPFALFKSNTINIELQNRSVYSSEIQHLAAPYLAVSSGFSVAVGMGIFGLLGWRHSARKLATVESNNAELTRSLTIHQAELERIKFSEARLGLHDLKPFLQPDLPLAAAAEDLVMPPEPQVQPLPVAAAVNPAEPPLEMVYGKASAPVYGSPQGGSARQTAAEPLESLLQQLQQLSQQVEELRGHRTGNLAA
ncbi:hypothetical protein [Nodosilinea sp. P-1105]|uniref:hypothetical protein n=1 Tax=Nodosilinea sp. P-1105 TaxID=2546229 RepID=UPI00146F418C|nr:hypothetical protein [Nodosilinea sp. P-1105]NMF84919.1 hypothetical protein [Nodosilinea sp. P-1105]